MGDGGDGGEMGASSEICVCRRGNGGRWGRWEMRGMGWVGASAEMLRSVSAVRIRPDRSAGGWVPVSPPDSTRWWAGGCSFAVCCCGLFQVETGL